MTQYLAGAGDAQLNYVAGQTVVLRLTPEEQVSSYVLQMPSSTSDSRTSAVRQTLAPGQQDVTVAATDSLGNYRLRAGGKDGRLDRGFSVNLPPEISRLERAVPAEIVESLGSNRTRIARTQEEIELRVGLGRVGRELFPALIIAVAVVLAAEQLLANRFYGSAGAASRAAQEDFAINGLRISSRETESSSTPIGAKSSARLAIRNPPCPSRASRRASMSDFQLRLQPVAGWPVVIAVAVVLVGLLFVRPRHVRLAVYQWAALVALRLVVVLLTLLAMLRPTLIYTKVEPQQASLVLLVDGSRSMQVADSLGDRSRWDSMKVLLEAAAPRRRQVGRNLGCKGV